MKPGTPIYEIAAPNADGVWRIYLSIYSRPFRVFAFGHWLIGRPW